MSHIDYYGETPEQLFNGREAAEAVRDELAARLVRAEAEIVDREEQIEELEDFIDGLVGSFSWALHMLRQGLRVRRRGWNGQGMFLFLVNGSEFTVNREPLRSILGDGKRVVYNPHIDIHCTDGSIAVWTPSQVDLMAHDWEPVADHAGNFCAA